MKYFGALSVFLVLVLQLIDSVNSFKLPSLEKGNKNDDKGKNNKGNSPQCGCKDVLKTEEPSESESDVTDYFFDAISCDTFQDEKSGVEKMEKSQPILIEKFVPDTSLIDDCEDEFTRESKLLKALNKEGVNDSVNPLEVWSLFDDSYFISKAPENGMKKKYETLGYVSETAEQFKNPKVIHRMSFRWPGGTFTFTYYGCEPLFEKAFSKKIKKVSEKFLEYVMKKIYKRNILKMIEKAEKSLKVKDPKDRLTSLQRLFYTEGQPEEVPVSTIALPKEVRRFTFEWPGNELIITFYGSDKRQSMDSLMTLIQILDGTRENMFYRLNVPINCRSFY